MYLMTDSVSGGISQRRDLTYLRLCNEDVLEQPVNEEPAMLVVRDVHELGVYLADKPHPQVKVWEYLPPAGWRICQVFLSAGTGSTFGDKNTRQVIHFCNISI